MSFRILFVSLLKMISNSSKYAIRSVLYLAIHSDEKNKLSAKKIAEEIKIPSAYLAKIFQTLSKKRLISATKGPKGGFYLTQQNCANTLLDIILCIDGDDKLTTCFLGLSSCSNDNPCPVHHIVFPFRENLFKEIQGKTIGEFAEEAKSGKTVIFLSRDDFESN